MGAGLIDIVSRGTEDERITGGNPEITFFKTVYRRHTNFAMETVEIPFDVTADFNRRVTCTLPRLADLLHKVVLKVVLPVLPNSSNAWSPYIGMSLIRTVEICVGGARIDCHMGEWLYVWNELSQTAAKRDVVVAMSDGFNQVDPLAARTVYVPLHFWFCKEISQSLPMNALLYHDVRIVVEFRELAEVARIGCDLPTNVSMTEASLLIDYVYLDDADRRMFSKGPIEYMIDVCQYTKIRLEYPTLFQRIPLTFKHPVRELIWVMRESSATLTGLTTIDAHQNEHFRFKLLGTNTSSTSAGTGASSPYFYVFGSTVGSSSTTANTTSLMSPILSEARVLLNGVERTTMQDAAYYGIMEPLKRHTGVPMDTINGVHTDRGIYCYSFAIEPELMQPTGTVNFSRIQLASIEVRLNSAIVGDTDVIVFAPSINFFRIQNGMGSIVYS